MERVNLFFLHGFLGRPSDWAVVKAHLPQVDGLHIFTPDYFKEKTLGPDNTFDQWAKNFNRWVERAGCLGQRNILVGYSLGGRLALHALEDKSSLWYKVMLISSNPGFNDEYASLDPSSEERTHRWLSDSYWADEFQKAPWDRVVRNWNALPVFGSGENEPLRIEKEYSRETLSLILTQWSLAQQRNLRSVLQKNVGKISWLVGEEDEKYLDIARSLQDQVPGLKAEVIPEASHRVPFDRPKILGEKIKSLIQQLL